MAHGMLYVVQFQLRKNIYKNFHVLVTVLDEIVIILEYRMRIQSHTSPVYNSNKIAFAHKLIPITSDTVQLSASVTKLTLNGTKSLFCADAVKKLLTYSLTVTKLSYILAVSNGLLSTKKKTENNGCKQSFSPAICFSCSQYQFLCTELSVIIGFVFERLFNFTEQIHLVGS